MQDTSSARFLQGIFEFHGQGLDSPYLLSTSLSYVVPPGANAQPVYFRGGNSTEEMIAVILMRDGQPMRYFPIGSRGSTHVSLRVVEDLLADTRLDVYLAAPKGLSGSVVVDVGLVEV